MAMLYPLCYYSSANRQLAPVLQIMYECRDIHELAATRHSRVFVINCPCVDLLHLCEPCVAAGAGRRGAARGGAGRRGALDEGPPSPEDAAMCRLSKNFIFSTFVRVYS